MQCCRCLPAVGTKIIPLGESEGLAGACTCRVSLSGYVPQNLLHVGLAAREHTEDGTLA